MWGNWKKKLGKLFSDHEADEQQEIRQENRNPNIKAKMTYQYPKEKPFRFPVIPDQQTERKTNAERPAYERRKPDARIQPINTMKSEQRNTNKVYKKNKDEPFTPTEVPSPIYGYQPRRKNKEIEDVPAYKRKREKRMESLKDEETAFAEITEEGIHQTAAGIITGENNRNEKMSGQLMAGESAKGTKGQIVTEDAVTDNSPAADIQHPGKNAAAKREKTDDQKKSEIPVEENIEFQQQDPQVDQQNSQKKTIHQQSSKKSDTYRKYSRKKHRNQQGSNKVPFNVMMTPADKKKQLERAQLQKTTVSETKTNDRIPFHLLDDKQESSNGDHRWIRQQRELLEQTLKHFNVKARVVNAVQGPTVTRFEVQPELGVKVSKVKNLSDDLKLNMAAKDIRIEAPIPGKRTIGIEIPNKKAQKVGLQGIFETDAFKNSISPLTIALGLNIEGTPLITNIQKMPHGLIAGATGSGKSVCINTILVSLLYKANYEDVKFLLIDPKMVELAPYNGIPHLVSPVITDVKAATQALKWAVREMEERYEKFVEEGVRDIERFNQKILGQERQDEKMPFIVIVIDELADLMMVAPQDVEDAISRIAQKARACGIHLLLATQRPSVDVITGLIKANIPTRIAFSVSSQVDSRTILDTSGAEKLLGKGDMLFIENGTGKSIRLQGPFVSDEEIERLTSYARTLAEPDYLFEQESLLKEVSMEETEDELLQDAITFVLKQQSASTSLLQRHYKIGYNRAARLIDTLESKGIISGQNGSKPREVLVTQAQLEENY
ncbi:DNA translocase FtsK [Virgibacillus sp. YIM 98842]|uniref:DNA translocase FtsK n=1 Tax=Virgibacillus sp. YIM 98842 TaxID=2663533 RepID=UPI0013DD7256|nr:DNA translocase FtsK [Virgibacillus sp. YIM 98842]